ELHAHVVHDPVVELDVAVLLGDLARDAQPEAVGEFHDVGLVHSRDLAAAVAARVVERELEDAAGAGGGNRLYGDPAVWGGGRPFERGACVTNRVENLGGQRIAAVLVHDIGAGLLDVPLEADSRRLEYAPRRLCELRPGAVAGDEDYAVRHRGRA